MSNAILNIRFGEWHLHIDRSPFRIWFGHNPYHADARKLPAWCWFEVMEWRPFA